MFMATVSFAQTTAVPTASSIIVDKDNNSINLLFLQDNKSAKPGLAWTKPIHDNWSFNWAVAYDSNNAKVVSGPMFGYTVIKSKYLTVTPLAGILTDISGDNKTKWSYGISASLDIGDLTKILPAPSVNKKARMLSVVKKAKHPVGGTTIMTTYSANENVGVGAGWTFGLNNKIGITPFASVNWPTGAISATVGVGTSVQMIAMQDCSINAFTGLGYNTSENYVKPVLGLGLSF
jgi:hypothetical protein